MKNLLFFRSLSLAFCLTLLLSLPALSQTLTIDRAETAGIDGREWDKTFPGAQTVDAVHRSVLLRFPGAAEQIKAKLDEGLAIEKAEVVFDYDGYEIAPPGYTVRTGLGQTKWKANPPRWHICAVPLRRAWRADKDSGPTFNAAVNGSNYWSKYGASDETADNSGIWLPPIELSENQPQNRLDITSLLSSGERLRWIEEKGLLLKKLETYDVRYRETYNSYEWAVPVGGHGLKWKNPRLAITFKPGAQNGFTLPPPADLAMKSGQPTAVFPSPADFENMARRAAFTKPEWMSDWQFERVQELYKIGGDNVSDWTKAVTNGDRKVYEKYIRDLLATPPRYWKGWGIQDDLLVWYLYRDLLPAYAQDHIKHYWTSWLMPDVPTKEFFHPQSLEAAEWWAKTQDWRGRASFFRGGYNYGTSTQNFNHTAAMGALLGGNIIGSEHALADGRHGLEHFPARLWGWKDGTTQEMLDHYYFSITLSAQKMFADFGPDHYDRLMGRVLLDRSMELLATSFHPNLRRVINASGRARISGVLVEQDGIYGALHTLSKKGALKYIDQPFKATSHGMPIWGYDFPPGRAAIQSLPSHWAPSWISHVIDDKPLPFEETSTETTRGMFNPPLWRRAYLGQHYGLASQDIKGGTVDVMAQWNSKSEPSTTIEDLGTLTLRYAINQPDMATTSGGTMPYEGGVVTFQDKNRAIICTKPRTEKDRLIKMAGDKGLQSLATVIALWNFRPQPNWEIYADGQLITQFPAKLKFDQVITIKDGVSYVGIIPLPATNLGRTDEIVIGPGGGGTSEAGKAAVAPALTITSYNFQKDAPVAFDDLDWPAINTASFGGFIIEMGDAREYPDFAAFQRRMQANKLTTQWNAKKKLLAVEYKSGADLMEMGFVTDYAQSEVHYAVEPGQHTKAIPYRRLNGQWPYLPPGLDRDTTLAQQGTSGRLEKNGAVLQTDKGRTAYLQTEPQSGTFVAYNPLPDLTDWQLQLPDNMAIKADGKVSLLRVEAQPKTNLVQFDYATKAEQSSAEMANNLVLSGFKQAPIIERNGKLINAPLPTRQENGQTVYVVPLRD